MKLLRDWGFTREGWRSGERGEYWVLFQGVLLVGFVLVPAYRPIDGRIDSPTLLYLCWALSTVLALVAVLFIVKGLMDLGGNLTPLPYPKSEGQLVRSGVYGVVRHPLYSGLIFAALSWTVFQFSLSHLVAVAVLFVFLDAKARKEEVWLTQKYPEYSDYQQHVQKLIPGLY